MTVLNSCSTIKEKETPQIKIVSDYCQVYSKFPDNLSESVISYWDNKQTQIHRKVLLGDQLSPEEELFKIFVIYSAKNESKYFVKCPLPLKDTKNIK